MNLKSLADRAAGFLLTRILLRALKKDRQHLNKDMSASIAFFGFLSMFPLILAVIAVGSRFLDSDAVRSYLYDVIVQTMPGSASFISENIDTLVRLRGSMTAASVVVLFWSASKMVGAITRGLNHTLEVGCDYAFFLSSLRSFCLTLTVPFLLFVSAAASPVAEVLATSDLIRVSDTHRDLIEFAAGQLTSFVIAFLVISTIYVLIPYHRPNWPSLLWGTLVATILYEVGKKGFLLYVSNATHFAAVYGSLSSMIVLLVWLYFSARFLLFGAEVVAALEVDKTKELE
jgi:membrane protein